MRQLGLVVLAITAWVTGSLGTAMAEPSVQYVAPPGSRELVDERTESATTYELPSGRRISVVSLEPQSVRRADRWQPIDNDLKNDERDGATGGTAAAIDVRLPSNASAPAHVGRADHSVSMRLLDAKAPMALNSGNVRYDDALPGVDLLYELRGQTLKESLIISGPDVPSVYRFELELSEGLRPRRDSSGAIEVIDAGGQARFTIPPAVMWDETEGPKKQRAVDSRLEETERGWQLELRPDAVWLKEVASDGVVVLDPTVVARNPTGLLCNIYPNGWLGGGFCGEGQVSTTPSVRRTVAHFNLASIPADAQITSAEFQADVSEGDVGESVEVRDLSVPFDSCVTWIYRKIPNFAENTCNGFEWAETWYQGGADGSTGSWSGTATVGYQGGWLNVLRADLRPVVQEWVDGRRPNNGLRFAKSGSRVSFYGNYGEEVGEPARLIIEYLPSTGIRPGHDFDVKKLTDRDTLRADVNSGNLMLESRDVQVATRSTPFTLVRTYNSTRTAPGMFGRATIASFGSDQRLVSAAGAQISDAMLRWTTPDGRVVLFRTDDVTTARAYRSLTADYGGKLSRTDAARFELLERDGTLWRFDAQGWPTSRADKTGAEESIDYILTPTKRPLRFTDSHGRQYALEYNAAGYLSQITDPTARIWRYAYDGDRLVGSTGPSGAQTQYGWNAQQRVDRVTTPEGRVTRLAYDPAGSITSLMRVTDRSAGTGDRRTYGYEQPGSQERSTVVVDERSKIWRYSTDDSGRTSRITPPVGPAIGLTWNSAGQPTGRMVAGALEYWEYLLGDPFREIAHTDAAGVRDRTRYSSAFAESVGGDTDDLGNEVTTDYQPSASANVGLPTLMSAVGIGPVKSIAYNGYRQVTSVSVPNGSPLVTYTYDTDGMRQSMTRPGLGTESYAHDALSRTVTSTDAANRTKTTAYDKLDRPTRATFGDGSSVSYEYDRDGNLTKEIETTLSGTVRTTVSTYDEKSRLARKQLPSGRQTDYTHDAGDNVLSLQDPGGTVSYSYDAASRLVSLTEPPIGAQVQTTTFGYDAHGQRTTTQTPSGLVVTRTQNAAGRHTALNASRGGTTILSRNYSYQNPANGSQTRHIFSEARDGGQSLTYTYDQLGRLYDVDAANPSVTYRYRYDPRGFMTSRVANGISVSYASNASGALASDTGGVYDSDPSGMRTGAPGGRTMTYNARGQTSSVKPGAAGSTVGLRFAGVDQSKPTEEEATTFENDELGLAQETASSGATYFTRTPDGLVIGERGPSGRRYAITDRQRSVLALTDSTGGTTSSTSFDPYGRTLSQTGAQSRFGFGGGQNTTGGYVRFGTRVYDPDTARWTQPDPIDQSCSVSEGNPWSYSGNDPVNFADPTGENIFEDVYRSGKRVLRGISRAQLVCLAYSWVKVGVQNVSSSRCQWRNGRLDCTPSLRQIAVFGWRCSTFGFFP